MAAKSDFAQKLLHDLRLRKERMTATQNSSRHSNQASRGKFRQTSLPVSFLHACDHNDEVADKKPILDCAYEVVKRKARRHQVTYHPYMNAILHKMLDKDINNEDPDVNSTWDFEWNKMMSMFPEKEDVIRDVEKHVLNGLLDEISNDLLLITVSV